MDFHLRQLLWQLEVQGRLVIGLDTMHSHSFQLMVTGVASMQDMRDMVELLRLFGLLLKEVAEETVRGPLEADKASADL